MKNTRYSRLTTPSNGQRHSGRQCLPMAKPLKTTPMIRYPSRLVLGWIGNRPLHVVVADHVEETQWVVTVYEPPLLVGEILNVEKNEMLNPNKRKLTRTTLEAVD